MPSATIAPVATVTQLPPETPSPAVTATPEATTSPVPTVVPAPVELTFDQPDWWDGTMTPPSSGPLGIVYAQSNIAYYVAKPNRLHAWAAVNVGVNERPTASVWLFNAFTAPGQGSTPITARISTSASWKGALAGAGAAGTGARATITLSVLEDGKALATKSVHTLEHRDSVLTAGGFRDTGSKDVEMEVSLSPRSRI